MKRATRIIELTICINFIVIMMMFLLNFEVTEGGLIYSFTILDWTNIVGLVITLLVLVIAYLLVIRKDEIYEKLSSISKSLEAKEYELRLMKKSDAVVLYCTCGCHETVQEVENKKSKNKKKNPDNEGLEDEEQDGK